MKELPPVLITDQSLNKLYSVFPDEGVDDSPQGDRPIYSYHRTAECCCRVSSILNAMVR